MKLSEEFNNKFRDSLDGEGMKLEYKSLAGYMDSVLKDLSIIPGFKWYEITTIQGMGYFDSNIEELIPCVGRIMKDEIQNQHSTNAWNDRNFRKSSRTLYWRRS